MNPWPDLKKSGWFHLDTFSPSSSENFLLVSSVNPTTPEMSGVASKSSFIKYFFPFSTWPDSNPKIDFKDSNCISAVFHFSKFSTVFHFSKIHNFYNFFGFQFLKFRSAYNSPEQCNSKSVKFTYIFIVKSILRRK